MKRSFASVIRIGGLALVAVSSATPQTGTPEQGRQQSAESVTRMARAVQHQILTLPEFGVFDDLNFSINNYVVTLKGFASRPILKSSAENVVKKIEGVEKVINRIEVLPLSPQDDEIRARTYLAIYYHTALSRYNPNRGSPIFRTRAQAAFGITNDPPIGFHPIHILVRSGNISLTGVVDNATDKAIAGMQANSVPGAFAVDNDLLVAEMSRPRKSRK